jgi:hypothetical protein
MCHGYKIMRTHALKTASPHFTLCHFRFTLGLLQKLSAALDIPFRYGLLNDIFKRFVVVIFFTQSLLTVQGWFRLLRRFAYQGGGDVDVIARVGI